MEYSEADFLRRILNEPRDVTTRLVYADWLDEQPDRLECETCRRPADAKNWVTGHTFSAYRYPQWQPCINCKGTTIAKCFRCGGSGRCSVRRGPADAAWYVRGDCPDCGGTGDEPAGHKDRAELIRLQLVALPGLLTRPASAEVDTAQDKYEQRVAELISRNWRRWTAFPGSEGRRSEFRMIQHGPPADRGARAWANAAVPRFVGGLVGSVKVGLRALWGPECQTCNGTGNLGTVRSGGADVEECADCSGRGYRHEAARGLFATHPLTEVVLTDVTPWRPGPYADYVTLGDYGNDDDQTERLSVVPEELVKFITAAVDPGAVNEIDAGTWWHFDTDAAAHDALSRAVVDWGRDLAGLPPLTRGA